jgi:hypothetical protein
VAAVPTPLVVQTASAIVGLWGPMPVWDAATNYPAGQIVRYSSGVVPGYYQALSGPPPVGLVPAYNQVSDVPDISTLTSMQYLTPSPWVFVTQGVVPSLALTPRFVPVMKASLAGLVPPSLRPKSVFKGSAAYIIASAASAWNATVSYAANQIVYYAGGVTPGYYQALGAAPPVGLVPAYPNVAAVPNVGALTSVQYLTPYPWVYTTTPSGLPGLMFIVRPFFQPRAILQVLNPALQAAGAVKVAVLVVFLLLNRALQPRPLFPARAAVQLLAPPNLLLRSGGVIKVVGNAICAVPQLFLQARSVLVPTGGFLPSILLHAAGTVKIAASATFALIQQVFKVASTLAAQVTYLLVNRALQAQAVFKAPVTALLLVSNLALPAKSIFAANIRFSLLNELVAASASVRVSASALLRVLSLSLNPARSLIGRAVLRVLNPSLAPTRLRIVGPSAALSLASATFRMTTSIRTAAAAIFRLPSVALGASATFLGQTLFAVQEVLSVPLLQLAAQPAIARWLAFQTAVLSLPNVQLGRSSLVRTSAAATARVLNLFVNPLPAAKVAASQLLAVPQLLLRPLTASARTVVVATFRLLFESVRAAAAVKVQAQGGLGLNSEFLRAVPVARFVRQAAVVLANLALSPLTRVRLAGAALLRLVATPLVQSAPHTVMRASLRLLNRALLASPFPRVMAAANLRVQSLLIYPYKAFQQVVGGILEPQLFLSPLAVIRWSEMATLVMQQPQLLVTSGTSVVARAILGSLTLAVDSAFSLTALLTGVLQLLRPVLGSWMQVPSKPLSQAVDITVTQGAPVEIKITVESSNPSTPATVSPVN